MGAIKDSMKIIEMSEQEIDALKAIIDELDLSDENKAAMTYGLNLIIWLPKLILEQRILLHRLQLMLFGKATSANYADLDITSTSDVDDKPQKSGRTGRKPHTEYKAIDHFIPH